PTARPPTSATAERARPTATDTGHHGPGPHTPKGRSRPTGAPLSPAACATARLPTDGLLARQHRPGGAARLLGTVRRPRRRRGPLALRQRVLRQRRPYIGNGRRTHRAALPAAPPLSAPRPADAARSHCASVYFARLART